ncbi:MAG: hypothetical protein LUE29_06980 [Lachnospiraceae bacterium]|nr:hypothetical protein [Lachnospiraceae bacterium]
MEKLSRVLSDFGLEPEKMTRVRGGFLLETEDGLRMLQEYRGGTAKLTAAETLQKFLRGKGFFRTDLLLRSKKGELSSRDVDGTVYVLKEWFEGQECSRENRGDLFAGMELLAELHGMMEQTEFAADLHPEESEKQPDGEANGKGKSVNDAGSRAEKASNDAGSVEEKNSGEIRKVRSIGAENLPVIFEKRIRELRRARNYLRGRRRKTDYESELLRHADYYISCGEKALRRLEASRYESLRESAMENGTIVHGAYHYHNILILSSGQEASAGVREGAESRETASPKSREAATPESRAAATRLSGRQRSSQGARSVAVAVNFERMAVGLQVTDVYDYIRKILEKNAWNRELGYRLIERYRRERPMSADEMEILRILFLFPEKYWKLVNHYCNHSKSWLPGKNPEKLATLVRQEEARVRFVEGI